MSTASRRAEAPFSPTQVGAAAVIFVFAAVGDPLIHRYCPAAVDALFSLALPALTFWLLWPRRSLT